MKVDLCITLPVTLGATYWSLQAAYKDVGDNMACYVEGDGVADSEYKHYAFMILVVFWAVHDNKKSQITHFIAKEHARKQ